MYIFCNNCKLPSIHSLSLLRIRSKASAFSFTDKNNLVHTSSQLEHNKRMNNTATYNVLLFLKKSPVLPTLGTNTVEKIVGKKEKCSLPTLNFLFFPHYVFCPSLQPPHQKQEGQDGPGSLT